MRDIKRIFIHCTASFQSITLSGLLNEFKLKGWNNPGYHYVVFPDGKVEQLLPESKISNGVQGYNSTSINVAYVGGIDKYGYAIDNRTEEQKEALKKLLFGLKIRYPNANIMGHRDIWGKDPKKWMKMCPCFDAEVEYSNIVDMPEIGKYEDATGTTDTGTLDDGTYDTVQIVKPKTYLDKLKELLPWMK